MRLTVLVTVVAAMAAMGCHGSRWAKRDADYRQKYPKHTDDPLKTVKQAIDARHVRGKAGSYIAGAGRDDPVAAGAEAGAFFYGEPWLEGRIGLAGLIHETGEHPISGGMLGSVRLQIPSRLAPFAGIGVYGGWAGLESADNDGYDNDNDGSIDEWGENDHALALAIFPEVGAHLWISHRTRITTSVTYYVTNQGRDDDFLFYSVGLSFFGNMYEDEPACPRIDEPSLAIEQFIQLPPNPPIAGTSALVYADLETDDVSASQLLEGPLTTATLPARTPTLATSQPATDEHERIQDISFDPIIDVQQFEETYPSTSADPHGPRL